MKLVQHIDIPTHKDGGILDHMYLYRPNTFKEVIISWELFCPFYSDHFGISIIINKRNNEFLTTPSTVPDDLLRDDICNKSSNKDNKKVVASAQKRRASSLNSTPKSRPRQ